MNISEMTQADRTDYINGISLKIVEDNVERKLAEARQMNRQAALNTSIEIIATFIRYNTLALFYSAMREV